MSLFWRSRSKEQSSTRGFKFKDLLHYPKYMPPVSEQTLRDLFYYFVLVVLPLQHSPYILTIFVFLMTLSWGHRLVEFKPTLLKQVFPENAKWMPVLLLNVLFTLGTMGFSSYKVLTFKAWLLGAFCPFIIVIMMYYFLQDLNHWRKALIFGLSYLMLMLITASRNDDLAHYLIINRDEWPVLYFTSQASLTWLLILFPLFFGLCWHHDKQYRKFSLVGLFILFLAGFYVAKLGFWLGLFATVLVMQLVYMWVGYKNYVFSSFMRIHAFGFKTALAILVVSGAISINGIFKNHGMEWISGWKAWLTIPKLESRILISGIGLGEDALRLFFEGVPRLYDLPWIISYFLQVGWIGVILLIWLWLAVLAGFVTDVLSSRADQQWVGMSGIGVMVAILASSGFSLIDLGTLTIPAAFVLSILLGLKRYLKMV